MDQDEFLTTSIVAIFGLLLLGAVAIMLVLAYQGKPIGEVLAFFTTAAGMAVAKFGSRYDHRYGSSRSTSAKDVVIDELSRRRK